MEPTSSKLRALILFVAVVLGVVIYMGSRKDNESGDNPTDLVPNLSGHSQMLALLKSIADNADNMYFGDGAIVRMRSQLAVTRPGTPQEVMLRLRLGDAELKFGRTEKAIEELKKTVVLMGKMEGRVSPEELAKWKFYVTKQLAIAYLRLGENENCVNCHTSESCIFPLQGGGIHEKKEGSQEAILLLNELLKINPEDALARWLLNLAHMTLGTYPKSVPAKYLIDPKIFDSDEEFPRFKNIAKQVGLDTRSLSGGAIADDFNNDGLLDIFVSSWDVKGQLHFFLNTGEGKFVDKTQAAGLTGLYGGLNLNQADYNNDGHTDIFVMRGAWLDEDGRHPNSLIRNNGDETFTDVTLEAGLAKENYPTQTSSWADYDNDGLLDLYVGNESGRLFAPSQLFHNNGDGTFSDVATKAGVSNDRYAKAVIWGDYDNDNDPDLYISNLMAPNRLYRNNGDGTFTDVAPWLGVDRPIWSFPAWFWDFNNDGALDIFVASYKIDAGTTSVAKSFLGLPFRAETARLYQGDGKGRFKEVTREQKLTQLTMPMGSNFGDLDNDGYPDFYLGTGYPNYEALMPNMMYRNQRGKGFANVTTSGGFGHLQKGHGVVFADLDNDGDQDVFEQMGGAFRGDAFGNVLFQNPGFNHHWLKVKLIGGKSNRSAIGARIRVEITEAGKKRSIFCHVNSGGSFGASPLRKEIGLGKADIINLLEIHWPTGGTTQTFKDIKVDSCLEIREGEKKYKVVALPKIEF